MLFLTHPNILKLLGCFWVRKEEKAYYVIVTEWCEKDLEKDIQQRAQNSYPFTETDLLAVCRQAIDALAFMQDQNIAHRDIKPQNIFLTSSKSIKIGDFGSASGTSYEFRDLVGTPYYLSPILKQALATRQARVQHNPFKSDVYSLGLTFLGAAKLGASNVFMNSVTDEKMAQEIAAIPYSEEVKTLLRAMLGYNEENRCDFLQMREWVTSRPWGGAPVHQDLGPLHKPASAQAAPTAAVVPTSVLPAADNFQSHVPIQMASRTDQFQPNPVWPARPQSEISPARPPTEVPFQPSRADQFQPNPVWPARPQSEISPAQPPTEVPFQPSRADQYQPNPVWPARPQSEISQAQPYFQPSRADQYQPNQAMPLRPQNAISPAQAPFQSSSPNQFQPNPPMPSRLPSAIYPPQPSVRAPIQPSHPLSAFSTKCMKCSNLVDRTTLRSMAVPLFCRPDLDLYCSPYCFNVAFHNNQYPVCPNCSTDIAPELLVYLREIQSLFPICHRCNKPINAKTELEKARLHKLRCGNTELVCCSVECFQSLSREIAQEDGGEKEPFLGKEKEPEGCVACMKSISEACLKWVKKWVCCGCYGRDEETRS
jgi:serine/threonine protein kinase